MEHEAQQQQPVEEGAAVDAAPAGPTEEQQAAEVVEHDLEELQTRAAQRDEFLALAQRTQADFENFRKRASREQGLAETRGVAKVVRELLPALDNFERALAAANGAEHHLLEGFRLVQAEVLAAIGRVGVQAYSPKGEPFDPNVHEAISQQPVEGAEPGTVVEVYQSGYRLEEAVIRPAKVIVAA